MNDTKLNLVLHPVRLRIINQLNSRQLTPHQIGEMLPDVAHATLYRHIKVLVDGEVLDVVEEKQVRGTVERVYTLRSDSALLHAEDVADLSKDDHEMYFTTFLFSLIGDFQRYLETNSNIDLSEDFVRYSKIPLHLTESEASELGQALIALIGKAGSHPPTPDRKRYLLSLVTMPDADVITDLIVNTREDKS